MGRQRLQRATGETETAEIEKTGNATDPAIDHGLRDATKVGGMIAKNHHVIGHDRLSSTGAAARGQVGAGTPRERIPKLPIYV